VTTHHNVVLGSLMRKEGTDLLIVVIRIFLLTNSASLYNTNTNSVSQNIQ